MPSSAPFNDLKMLSDIQVYKRINNTVAQGGLKGLGLQMWYLTEELIPLVLFSSQVDSNTKQMIAQKILSYEQLESCSKREGTKPGKPVFPKITGDVVPTLVELVGQDSWAFFRILRIPPAFLQKPVEEWESDCDFKAGKHIVSHLSVANDGAERGVKICSDFLESSKNEDNFQNFLQVVENYQKVRPNMPKKKEDPMDGYWYLVLEDK